MTNITVVDPKSPLPEGKKELTYVAVTAWSPVYELGTDLPPEGFTSKSLIPVSLMSFRNHGGLEFVGGTLLEGEETPLEAVLESAVAEANLALDPNLTKHLVSHETDNYRIHLFQMNLGVVPRDVLAVVLMNAGMADMAVTRGSMIWAHLADYPDNMGFIKLANRVSSAVTREQLFELRDQMMKNIPEE